MSDNPADRQRLLHLFEHLVSQIKLFNNKKHITIPFLAESQELLFTQITLSSNILTEATFNLTAV